MKTTELEQLAETLQSRYREEKKHYEIVKAERTTLGWNLTIREIFTNDDEENEGAENDSDK